MLQIPNKRSKIMMSCIHNGKVLDYHYKKLGNGGIAFYIGDIYVGQLYKIGKSWSVVGKSPHPLAPISGLRTRWQGAELLLRLEGYSK